MWTVCHAVKLAIKLIIAPLKVTLYWGAKVCVIRQLAQGSQSVFKNKRALYIRFACRAKKAVRFVEEYKPVQQANCHNFTAVQFQQFVEGEFISTDKRNLSNNTHFFIHMYMVLVIYCAIPQCKHHSYHNCTWLAWQTAAIMCHEPLRDFDDEINRLNTDIFQILSGMLDCCEKAVGGLKSLKLAIWSLQEYFSLFKY